MSTQQKQKTDGGIGGFLVFCFIIFMISKAGGGTPTPQNIAFAGGLKSQTIEFVEKTETKAILKIPYINQWLNTENKKSVPGGELMCGAASSIMVLAAYGKIPYKSESELQQYLTKDYEGISPRIPGCDNLSGVFQRTAYSGHCKGSLPANIYQLMLGNGLETSVQASYKKMLNINEKAEEPLTLQQIKNHINSGNPLILNFISGKFDHIVVIVGYEGDQLIVHDPYTDVSRFSAPVTYDTGKFVRYSVSADGRTIFPNTAKKGTIVYTIAPKLL